MQNRGRCFHTHKNLLYMCNCESIFVIIHQTFSPLIHMFWGYYLECAWMENGIQKGACILLLLVTCLSKEFKVNDSRSYKGCLVWQCDALYVQMVLIKCWCITIAVRMLIFFCHCYCLQKWCQKALDFLVFISHLFPSNERRVKYKK